MDLICLVAALLYNTGVSPMTLDWLPVEYLTCPTQLAMRKIAAITPAGYFCMIRKPHFLSMDWLGVDQKFYLNPEHLPSNDNHSIP